MRLGERVGQRSRYPPSVVSATPAKTDESEESGD